LHAGLTPNPTATVVQVGAAANRCTARVLACQRSEAPLGGASLVSVIGCQFAGRKKRLTARLPIFSPWSVPVSTASRKWKPT
jgi:hypothetical protein